MTVKGKLPKLPSIRRLPGYLALARELRSRGESVVSTTFLAEELKLESIVVRKDLAMTAVAGQPGVGYRLDEMISEIEKFLNWNNSTDAFLVGAGALGTALLGYSGFEEHGVRIVAAFDADEKKIGSEIYGKKDFNMDSLVNLGQRMKVNLGILCVPSDQAQSCADRMVAAGIKAIWNFSSRTLKVPPHIVVQKETLASGLAVLSVKLAKQFEVDGKSC